MNRTMTIATPEVYGRRRQISKSSQTQLPAIAPKHKTHSTSSSSQSKTAAANGTANVPRTRLPPRSRFGCWYVLQLYGFVSMKLIRSANVGHVGFVMLRNITGLGLSTD